MGVKKKPSVKTTPAKIASPTKRTTRTTTQSPASKPTKAAKAIPKASQKKTFKPSPPKEKGHIIPPKVSPNKTVTFDEPRTQSLWAMAEIDGCLKTEVPMKRRDKLPLPKTPMFSTPIKYTAYDPRPYMYADPLPVEETPKKGRGRPAGPGKKTATAATPAGKSPKGVVKKTKSPAKSPAGKSPAKGRPTRAAAAAKKNDEDYGSDVIGSGPERTRKPLDVDERVAVNRAANGGRVTTPKKTAGKSPAKAAAVANEDSEDEGPPERPTFFYRCNNFTEAERKEEAIAEWKSAQAAKAPTPKKTAAAKKTPAKKTLAKKTPAKKTSPVKKTIAKSSAKKSPPNEGEQSKRLCKT